MKYVSFPYQQRSDIFIPRRCQSERHSNNDLPAKFLEIMFDHLYDPSHPPMLVIYEAWFTCKQCHLDMVTIEEQVIEANP